MAALLEHFFFQDFFFVKLPYRHPAIIMHFCVRIHCDLQIFSFNLHPERADWTTAQVSENILNTRMYFKSFFGYACAEYCWNTSTICNTEITEPLSRFWRRPWSESPGTWNNDTLEQLSAPDPPFFFYYVFAFFFKKNCVFIYKPIAAFKKNRVKKRQGGWMINWRDFRKIKWFAWKKKSSSHFARKISWNWKNYVFKSILIRTANTVCARLRQISQIQFQ